MPYKRIGVERRLRGRHGDDQSFDYFQGRVQWDKDCVDGGGDAGIAGESMETRWSLGPSVKRSGMGWAGVWIFSVALFRWKRFDEVIPAGEATEQGRFYGLFPGHRLFPVT